MTKAENSALGTVFTEYRRDLSYKENLELIIAESEDLVACELFEYECPEGLVRITNDFLKQERVK